MSRSGGGIGGEGELDELRDEGTMRRRRNNICTVGGMHRRYAARGAEGQTG